MLDFRQSISKLFEQTCDQDNNVTSDLTSSEDPLHPTVGLRAASKDVQPQKLQVPNPFFNGATPTVSENKPQNDQVITCNGSTKNEETNAAGNCDNLSAVSMGLSSSSSESVILHFSLDFRA